MKKVEIKTIEVLKTSAVRNYTLEEKEVVEVLRNVDGGTSSQQQRELLSFINNCNNTRIDVYLKVTYKSLVDINGILHNIYSCMSCFSKYNVFIRDLLSHSEDSNFIEYLYTQLSVLNVKGIRKNHTFSTLIKKLLNDEDINIIDNEYKQHIYDKLTDKEYTRIVYIGNNALAQLTSTYTDCYDSCYNLECGGYRASNVFLMNDKNNLIIKIYDNNDTNIEAINNDTLCFKYGCYSRRNVYIDNKNNIMMIARNYGDCSGLTYNKCNIIDMLIASKFINNNYAKLGSSSDLDNCEYCDSFRGYEDYHYSTIYTLNKDVDNYYNNVVVGGDNYITWYISDSEMIISHYHKVYDEYEDTYIDEDDAIYVDSEDTYAHCDDVYYDDNVGEYFRYCNTNYVELNGRYYNLDNLDVTYNG